jgi:hypothetical protein
MALSCMTLLQSGPRHGILALLKEETMFIVYDQAYQYKPSDRDDWIGQFEFREDAEECLGDWESRGNDDGSFKAGYIVEVKQDV